MQIILFTVIYFLIGFILAVAFQVLIDQDEPVMGMAFFFGWPIVTVLFLVAFGSSGIADWIRHANHK